MKLSDCPASPTLTERPDGTIYETQKQRDQRIEHDNLWYKHKRKRSRNKARTKESRREVMDRANSTCEICCFNFALVLNVHHIIPVASGGSAHRGNLIVLCPNCHALAHHYRHHRRPEKYEGWIVGLMKAGLTKEQGLRLLLVASSEAVVNDDGSIEPWVDPRYEQAYVLIDEPKTVGGNLNSCQPSSVNERSPKDIEECWTFPGFTFPP